LEAQLGDPDRIIKLKFKPLPKAVKKMSSNLTRPPDMHAIYKKNDKNGVYRESNKDEVVF